MLQTTHIATWALRKSWLGLRFLRTRHPRPRFHYRTMTLYAGLSLRYLEKVAPPKKVAGTNKPKKVADEMSRSPYCGRVLP